MGISNRFVFKLEKLRVAAGFPFKIASGSRCPAHNQKVSGTGPDGPHTKEAVDITVSGADALQLVGLAIEHGFTGIGVSQKGEHGKRFIHLDDLPNAPGQPRPWVWSY